MQGKEPLGPLVILALLLGGSVAAKAETSYRDPGDMKEEERIAMMGKTND